jgi:outer membrane cobalamin receptor
MLTSLVLALLLSQSAPPTAAQTVTVSGRVTSGAPPQPVAGAVAGIGPASTLTDESGQFTLTVPAPVPPARTVRLVVISPGFIDATFDVAPGSAPLDIVLQPSQQVREQVTVSATASDQPVAPPTLVVAPTEVTAVAGALDNVFRVLQTLPGVSATDDFGSRLSVRGGGPDQNLTVMDGVEIHNPYRLFGLTSAFNPETIDRFELTAGGFSAKYGDRLSSILVVDNRRGSSSRAALGSASLSLTDANVVLEGRLPGGASGSWLVTGRRTYYDLFAERITDEDLPSFGDLQTKMSWSPKQGRELTIFGLRSRESTDAKFRDGNIDANFGIKDASSNDVLSLTYTSAIGARATSRTIASWYRFGDALDVDGSQRDETRRFNVPGNDAFERASIVFTRDVSVHDVSLRQEVSAPVSDRHTIETGLEAHALRTTWGWTIAGDRNNDEANGSSALGGSGLPDLLDSSANSARVGAWLEDDIRLGSRARVAGGLRIDWNGISRETIASPRLRLQYELGPRTTLRAATGLYTQSPGYEKLLQSDYFVDLTNASDIDIKSERSRHVVGGLEHQITPGVNTRVEAYYKTFERLLVGRLETQEETAARVAEYAFPADLAWSVPTAPQITSIPSNSASGNAYGFDVYLQKRATGPTDRVTGWISYTWGKAFIENYGRRYAFDYDRRHALSLVSTLRLTRRFDLATTLRVASGFPENKSIGVRVASMPAEARSPARRAVSCRRATRRATSGGPSIAAGSKI